MRRSIGVLLAATVAACGLGGSARGDAAAPVDACALLPSTSLARWETQDRRHLAAAFTAAGVAHEILNARGSGARQRAQARRCLAGGAKALVLAGVDPRSGRAIGRLAEAAGATVIDYGRVTPGGAASYYVGPDDVLAGRLLALGVVAALPRPRGSRRGPVVAVLDGPREEPASTLVARGRDSTLARRAASLRLERGPVLALPSWAPAPAAAAAARLAGSSGRGGADAVVASDDRLAAAVVVALRAAGRRPIPLSGRSASVTGVRNVLSGWQTGTVYDSAKQLAGAAARAATSVVRGLPVQTNGVTSDGARKVPAILVRPVWITRGNYAALFAEGLYTRSELCSGAYARFCR